MRLLLAAALAATMPYGAMAATLTGDRVDLRFDGNGTQVNNQRIGAGTDIQLGFFGFDLDGGADSDGFKWSARRSASFGGGTTGITFSDLDFSTGVLSGFTITKTALTDLDFTFTDSSISFTFSDTGFSSRGTLIAGTFLTSQMTTPGPVPGSGPDVPAVPLPAGLPLLALGLGALGIARRRKA